GNLTQKQVEYAKTIHSSGSDLLSLINDVLDIAKVEAGKMEVNAQDTSIAEMKASIDRGFRPMAEEKGLDFKIDVHPDTPAMIYTDAQRVEQILKNLLSNAFKFTQDGSVSLTIRKAETNRRFMQDALNRGPVIAFAVSDTGIGIAADKQRLIFEAFQQADGTTSRKFGGTGLGLSISREIARLLGGEIRVESAPGKGSTFTLFLPVRFRPAPSRRGGSEPVETFEDTPRTPRITPSTTWRPTPAKSAPAYTSAAVATPERRAAQYVVEDDHENIEPGDRTVLIVENDANFARTLLVMAREKGFKGIVCLDGDSGLAAAHEYRPDAITLDIDMPGLDGWKVLERLKHHPSTRHIPVHIISGIERRQQGLKAGALAYLAKPVSKEALDDAFSRIANFIEDIPKHLLVVEDDEGQRSAIVDLIAHEDVEITAVDSAEKALEELSSDKHYDCVVLDLGLHDMSGFDFLEKVKSDPDKAELPIIVYTGKQLSQAEETRIKKYAETIIVKDVRSPERLLDETALFLHRVEAKLPEQKRKMLEQLHDADAVIAGKHVLIVDDDVRNIFSLTSVLEDHGMVVRFAENGKDALAALKEDPDVDAVLMDVMMPEMDGYETTRAIREMSEFKSLPIIALTAKAMKGDREKCIAAGASDYITKPVDTEQLLSLLRVWLYK
ncbi:MAG TPA: response regulator, partial [Gemmatimonadaceae bacterium]|nr:response regulator [Gemmatimonadaceae bacterium]